MAKNSAKVKSVRKEPERSATDLLTEDESSFYSCDESLNRNQVFEQNNEEWMTELTELTEDEDDKCKTPVNRKNINKEPNGNNAFPVLSTDEKFV